MNRIFCVVFNKTLKRAKKARLSSVFRARLSPLMLSLGLLGMPISALANTDCAVADSWTGSIVYTCEHQNSTVTISDGYLAAYLSSKIDDHSTAKVLKGRNLQAYIYHASLAVTNHSTLSLEGFSKILVYGQLIVDATSTVSSDKSIGLEVSASSTLTLGSVSSLKNISSVKLFSNATLEFGGSSFAGLKVEHAYKNPSTLILKGSDTFSDDVSKYTTVKVYDKSVTLSTFPKGGQLALYSPTITTYTASRGLGTTTINDGSTLVLTQLDLSSGLSSVTLKSGGTLTLSQTSTTNTVLDLSSPHLGGSQGTVDFNSNQTVSNLGDRNIVVESGKTLTYTGNTSSAIPGKIQLKSSATLKTQGTADLGSALTGEGNLDVTGNNLTTQNLPTGTSTVESGATLTFSGTTAPTSPIVVKGTLNLTQDTPSSLSNISLEGGVLQLSHDHTDTALDLGTLTGTGGTVDVNSNQQISNLGSQTVSVLPEKTLSYSGTVAPQAGKLQLPANATLKTTQSLQLGESLQGLEGKLEVASGLTSAGALPSGDLTVDTGAVLTYTGTTQPAGNISVAGTLDFTGTTPTSLDKITLSGSTATLKLSADNTDHDLNLSELKGMQGTVTLNSQQTVSDFGHHALTVGKGSEVTYTGRGTLSVPITIDGTLKITGLIPKDFSLLTLNKGGKLELSLTPQGTLDLSQLSGGVGQVILNTDQTVSHFGDHSVLVAQDKTITYTGKAALKPDQLQLSQKSTLKTTSDLDLGDVLKNSSGNLEVARGELSLTSLPNGSTQVDSGAALHFEGTELPSTSHLTVDGGSVSFAADASARVPELTFKQEGTLILGKGAHITIQKLEGNADLSMTLLPGDHAKSAQLSVVKGSENGPSVLTLEVPSDLANQQLLGNPLRVGVVPKEVSVVLAKKAKETVVRLGGLTYIYQLQSKDVVATQNNVSARDTASSHVDVNASGRSMNAKGTGAHAYYLRLIQREWLFPGLTDIEVLGVQVAQESAYRVGAALIHLSNRFEKAPGAHPVDVYASGGLNHIRLLGNEQYTAGFVRVGGDHTWIIGADKSLRVGALLDVQSGATDTFAKNFKLKQQQLRVGVYAGGQFQKSYLGVYAGYEQLTQTMDALKLKRHLNAVQLSVEGGLKVFEVNYFSISPELQVQYTYFMKNHFTTTYQGLSSKVQSMANHGLKLRMGVKFNKYQAFDGINWNVYSRLSVIRETSMDWQFEGYHTDEGTTVAYQQKIAETSVQVGAGVQASVRQNFSLSLELLNNRVISSDAQSYRISGGLNYRF